MEEIKAGDIMLNNWFHVNGYPMYVEAIFRDTVYLEFKGNEGDVWEESIKDLKPIPLTEDILLKCGARKVNHIHGYSFFTFSNSKINKAHIDIYEKKTCYYGSYVAKCKYLHQIQNLFKAITQTDLKVEV